MPSASRSAISQPISRPASPAATVPKASEMRKGHGSPNGQSALTHRTPNAYIPMPQKPTIPKLPIPARPICRWSSRASPIIITTKNSPKTRNEESQSRFKPLHLPRFGQGVPSYLQDDHEGDDQSQP